MTRRKVVEFSPGTTNSFIKASGSQERKTAMDHFTSRMAAITRAIFVAIRSMALDFTNGKTQGPMKASGNIIPCAAKVSSNGIMATSTKDTSKITKCTAMAFSLMQTAGCPRGATRMERSRAYLYR